MPELCRTCGRRFAKWRRLHGNKVPDHEDRLVNARCVRGFDQQLAVKAASRPIKETDGRLR